MTSHNHAHKATPPQSRFQDALDLLPHVHHRGKQGLDYWHISEPQGAIGDVPLALADYGMDCLLGTALWQNFRNVIRRYPEEAETIVEMTLKHMVKNGRLTGVEIAFLGHMAREMTRTFVPLPSKVTPISIAPIATQPDGKRGYNTERREA